MESLQGKYYLTKLNNGTGQDITQSSEDALTISNCWFPKLISPPFPLNADISGLPKPALILSMGVPTLLLERMTHISKMLHSSVACLSISGIGSHVWACSHCPVLLLGGPYRCAAIAQSQILSQQLYTMNSFLIFSKLLSHFEIWSPYCVFSTHIFFLKMSTF